MVPKLIVFAVIASVIAVSCGEVSERPQPHPETNTSSTSTTTASTSTTSTTSTTTADPVPVPTSTTSTPPTSKPTTPTTPPTTPTTPTTTAPTTPTTAPTTPTTAPTTPTPAPTTPTPPPTTPKPSPKPPQKPDVGKWNVTSNNVTCILVDMAIQLNVTYPAINMTKYSILDVPQNITASGTCGNTTQLFNLTWFENGTKSELYITFTKNETENKFEIAMINLTILPDKIVFPDIRNVSVIKLFSDKTEFPTQLSKSYHCEKEQIFDLSLIGSNTTEAKMTVSHVHLEAFHTKNNRNFGAAEDCEPSSSPDVVPIAVGCCLGGLVVIVLVAYLVGRRRSQARGYLSM